MPRRVAIHIENKVTPEKLAVGATVSRFHQDQIEWKWDSEPEDITTKIIFTGECPFREKEFTVPQKGSVCSGPVAPDVETGRFYKYDVVKLKNGKEVDRLDPKVFVDD